MSSISFVNHETEKIVLGDTNAALLLIAIILLAVIISSLTKKKFTVFLDNTNTDQLKGLAILLIVVGHINQVVLKNFYTGTQLGVALFLFCSGYGLTASSYKKEYTLKSFFVKRLTRIFIPYWVTTSILLITDSLILKKKYTTVDMASTFLGINYSNYLMDIDHARWFITFILVYYAIFFIATKMSRNLTHRILFIWASSLLLMGFMVLTTVLFSSNYNVFNLFSYGPIFPLGCLVFHVKDRVINAARKVIRTRLTTFLVIVLPGLFILLNFIIMNRLIVNIENVNIFTSRGVVLCILQMFGMVFFIILLVSLSYVMVEKRYSLSLLRFIGGVSYEIFLLHGVLMIKYDFLLYRKPFVLYFIVYLLLLLILSYVLKTSVSDRGRFLIARFVG